jgi:hypothetical protein
LDGEIPVEKISDPDNEKYIRGGTAEDAAWKFFDYTDAPKYITVSTPADINGAIEEFGTEDCKDSFILTKTNPLHDPSGSAFNPKSEREISFVASEKIEETVKKNIDSRRDKDPGETEHTVMARIIRGVFRTAKSSKNETTIQLYPTNLGDVRIRLRVDDGVTTARIAIRTESAKKIIQKNFNLFRAMLAKHKVEIRRFEILISL